MDNDSSDETVVFLSLADIETIHTDQLAKYGGQDGYRNREAIESAVHSPKASMFGEPLYPDIADKASVYIYQISESQGFTDGNKRTGAVAAYTFLLMNGYDINATEHEFYLLAITIAQKQMDREAAADWIRERLEPEA